MSEYFLNSLEQHFPTFAHKLRSRPNAYLENIQPGATDNDLAEIELSIKNVLPESYKTLLRCARGFWLFGGAIQFEIQHPFTHNFQPYHELTPQQQQSVQRKSKGEWPPPSSGMLCFADFFMEADGDQVLFDITHGMRNGEYPIMYYSHDSHPPLVRKLTVEKSDLPTNMPNCVCRFRDA